MPIPIASRPTISEQMRAALSSSSEVALSPLITPTQMSCGSAEAEEERQHVEAADDRHRPDHALARLLGRRDGEESHQYVRQSRGAEDERHAERDLVDRTLEQQPRLEKALAELGRAHVARGVAE